MPFSSLHPKKHSEKAYTLLEMAIVFTVIGILMTVLIQAYGIYSKKKIVETTERNVFSVINSVNAYMAQNGRYPCPAPLNVTRDSPAYGFESADCVDHLNSNIDVCGSWGRDDDQCPLVRGVYRLNAGVENISAPDGIMEGGRSRVNIDPRSSVNCRVDPYSGEWNDECVAPVVWQGAVPFRTLGLPENVSEDGYSAKINYAVSENLTAAASYRKDGGVISVVDERKNPLISPQGSAHFVVFSSGRDKRGAYSRSGTLMAPCPENTRSTTDALNCPTARGKGRGDILDQVAFTESNSAASRDNPYMPVATFRQARYADSMTVPTMYFDDYVRFYTSSESPLWRVADAEGRNITDLASTNAQSKVGVGFVNADPDANLQLAGNGAASVLGATSLKGEKICDREGNNCFSPEQIAGANGCTLDANGVPVLAPDGSGYGVNCDTDSNTSMNCPEGSYITRIYGEGGVAKVECSQDLTITCPAGQAMLGIDGDGKLICEGVAACPPLTVNTCNIGGVWRNYTLPSGLQGGTFDIPTVGFSYRASYKCDSGAWRPKQPQPTTGHCECTPVTNQIVKSCAEDKGVGFWDGTTTSEFTRVCNADGTITDNTRVIQAADTACTCRVGQQTQTRACDPGFSTGSKLFKRDWECQGDTNGRWVVSATTDANGWYEDVAGSTCRCVESTENQQKNCSEFLPGWSGTFTQSRGRRCPTATPPGSAAGVMESWAPVPTAQAPSGCQCNASYSEIAPPASCPAGQSGYVEQMRVLCCSTSQTNCGGVTEGTLSPWFTSSNTCAATSYQWTEIASGGEPQFSNTPIANRAIGTPCSPTQNVNATTCSAAYSNASYRLVSCRCQ